MLSSRASFTASGAISATFFRPSHLPRPSIVVRSALARLRSRAPLKFLDQARLFQLGKSSCDLPHCLLHSSSVLVRSSPLAVMMRTPIFSSDKNAEFLRHQVASETAGVFNDHDADAVAFDAIEQAVEAGTRLDRVSAGDGRIIKEIVRGDFEAGALCISDDCLALPLLAVLIRANVCGARGPKICDRLNASIFARFLAIFLVRHGISPSSVSNS